MKRVVLAVAAAVLLAGAGQAGAEDFPVKQVKMIIPFAPGGGNDTVGRLFPDLKPTDFEHVWSGKIAHTTDHAPHLQRVDGVWLIGGYCGSGVTRSLYFADKLVRKITHQPASETPFDDLEFPRVPFRPVAPFGARMLTGYYAWLDRRDRKRERDRGRT